MVGAMFGQLMSGQEDVAQRLQGRAEHHPAAAVGRRPDGRLPAAAAGRGRADQARRQRPVAPPTARSTRASRRSRTSSRRPCCPSSPPAALVVETHRQRADGRRRGLLLDPPRPSCPRLPAAERRRSADNSGAQLSVPRAGHRARASADKSGWAGSSSAPQSRPRSRKTASARAVAGSSSTPPPCAVEVGAQPLPPRPEPVGGRTRRSPRTGSAAGRVQVPALVEAALQRAADQPRCSAHAARTCRGRRPAACSSSRRRPARRCRPRPPA